MAWKSSWQSLWESFLSWHLPLLTVFLSLFPSQPSREVLWKWQACEMPLSPCSLIEKDQFRLGLGELVPSKCRQVTGDTCLEFRSETSERSGGVVGRGEWKKREGGGRCLNLEGLSDRKARKVGRSGTTSVQSLIPLKAFLQLPILACWIPVLGNSVLHCQELFDNVYC